jgi:hypothetical protein
MFSSTYLLKLARCSAETATNLLNANRKGYRSNHTGGFSSSSFLSSSFFAFFRVTLFCFFGLLSEAAFFSSKIFFAQSFQ